MPPATARPGTRSGLTTAGTPASSLQVVDRPMTRQGLTGVQTGFKRSQRTVQDRTYWFGIIKNKTTELSAEIAKLQRDWNNLNQDQAGYNTSVKRAEAMAAEMKDLQNQLVDYNLVLDRVNSKSDQGQVQQEIVAMRKVNEQEDAELDHLFSVFKRKESELQKLEALMMEEQNKAARIIENMTNQQKDTFSSLQSSNQQMDEEVHAIKEEIERLKSTKKLLQQKMLSYPDRQEAANLIAKLHDVTKKKAELETEISKETTMSPEQEKEVLLKQMKIDNEEISSFETRASEVSYRIDRIQEEIQQIEVDLESDLGDRMSKFQELKKREEVIQEFLSSFEETKSVELSKKRQFELEIISLLENTSRVLTRMKQAPSTNQYHQLKDDLDFKEKEMVRSKETAAGLDVEHQKLQSDLMKVDEIEKKLSKEKDFLTKKSANLKSELENFSDIDGLKKRLEGKRQLLADQKTQLLSRRPSTKLFVEEIEKKYQETKTRLEESDSYVQVSNLERKLQHLEQTNFAIKDYVASKLADIEFESTKTDCLLQAKEINNLLIQLTSDNGTGTV